MAYITYFTKGIWGQRDGPYCEVESDLYIDFKLKSLKGGDVYHLSKDGEIIAVISHHRIESKDDFIKQVKLRLASFGWMLNGDSNRIVERYFKGNGYIMNNQQVAWLTSGGGLIHSLFSSIKNKKFNWTDPYTKIEFKDNSLTALEAVCLLISGDTCSMSSL